MTADVSSFYFLFINRHIRAENRFIALLDTGHRR